MACVLILSLNFPPDGVSTAQLMGDLAVDLQKEGHEVTVLTSQPHNNTDLEARASQLRRAKWGPLLSTSEFHGIPVYHVYMPRKSPRTIPRLAQWFWFHVISTVAGWTVVKRPDVILATSPPLTIGLNAWIIGRLGRIPYIFNVWELFPDIAVASGYLNQGRFLRLLKRLERFTYQKAEAVTAISDEMRETLVAEERVAAPKLHVIPNSVDVRDIFPVPKDNGLAREYGFHKKFVVTYAGNIGPLQQLDDLVDAAIYLRDEADVQFALIGGGSERTRIAKRILARIRVSRLGEHSLT